RYGLPQLSHKEKKRRLVEKINTCEKPEEKLILKEKLSRVPTEVENDLLWVMLEFGHHLEEWKKDLINIVREESLYFIPQIKTKILNEGWASFWHYKIMHELDLPQEY
ncbi:MAG TPA: stage V sporulation protein R, partial [Maribacter sp.]|nr:stage V sporulation protein R [Maribacter sp.]